MYMPTDKFMAPKEGYVFTDLDGVKEFILAPIYPGCIWFISIVCPNGSIGCFNIRSGYDSSTTKYNYTAYNSQYVTVLQTVPGTITAEVDGYSPVYDIIIDLDTAHATIGTVSETAVGETKIKIKQVA